jgi:hypothetical protein
MLFRLTHGGDMDPTTASGTQVERIISSESPAPKPGAATPLEIAMLVSALLLVFVFLAYVLLKFWPSPAGAQAALADLSFAGIPLSAVGNEGRWFVLVMAAGALGSFVHAATSAGDFIGNDRLLSAWLPWYLLRLPIGASLALLIYMLLRGGVLTGMQLVVTEGQQPYGVIGLAALAGMFSEKATKKLAEVFEAMFKSGEPDKRTCKLDDVGPLLERIEPNPVTAGATAPQTLRLIGKRFQRSTRVLFGDETNERKPELVSQTELKLVLQPTDLKEAREVAISVVRVGGDEPASAPITLVIQQGKPS